jgi:pSer/pThr/pTyr-binding forkhead associated (FHA) protein
MQVVMVMFRADGERRSFSLTRDLTVIGRREDCDLRIPLGDVSRKHCRVVRNGDYITLEDLGSSNGTFVNGQRIQEATLNAGDTVQVGPVVFCVQIDGVPGEDEMAPIFAAPAEPGFEGGLEPIEEVGEPMDEGVEAVEESPTTDPDAELDDFEAVEADDAEPVAAVPPPLPTEQGEEEVAELTEDVFLEDAEVAAQADQIAETLEETEPPVDASAQTTEDEVALEDFEIIESEEATPENDEQSESGEAPSNTNRH